MIINNFSLWHKVSSHNEHEVRAMKKQLKILFFLVTVLPFISFAQNSVSKKDYNKTLLQVSSGFYTVEKNATVDLDSSLLITSLSHRLSRVCVITEEIDDNYAAVNCRWMDKNNTDSVRKRLTKIKGADQARLSLLIGAYYAFHPGFEKKYIDSGIFYLTLAKKMCDNLHLVPWSLQCSCLLGKCYFKRNDIPTGTKWFKIITDNANQISEQYIIAKAWNYEGMYCPFLANTTTFRIDCLRKALAIYKNLNDGSNQINTLMNIAYLSFANRQIKDAEDAATTSLALQKLIHFTYNQYSYDLLAYFAIIKADYPKQLTMALNAVNSAEVNKDSLALGHFYARVATSYDFLHSAEETIKWEKKALAAYKITGADHDLYIMLSNAGMKGSDIGEGSDYVKIIEDVLKKDPPTNSTDRQYAYMALGQGYQKQNNYKKAEIYYIKADSLEKYNLLAKGGLSNYQLIYTLGQFYFEIKDYNKSKFYYLKLLAPPYEPITPKGQLMHSYYRLHVIDSVSGNYLSSLNYLHQYSNLNEAIFSEKQSKQLTALNVKYETAQKEKNLQLLKAQNQLEMQKADTTKKITYTAIIVLLLVIIVVYNRYYYNKKNNNLLQAQKTEIDEQNHSLQIMNHKQTLLLKEKELLMREIHHRVKNNLQTTMSLLNMQSAYISNEAALEAIKSSQRRMHAMSLIHQQLYQSDTVTEIDMSVYVKELVSSLKESFSGMDNIAYNLQVQPSKLDAAEAVPLGLIINEAVTNAIKYAFPDDQKGFIAILLDHCEDGYKLSVEDNGIGLPAGFGVASKKSLGMNLMRGLTDQLQGEFSIERNKGTKIIITFKSSELLTA
jgi:two-component system, sensor histidine kinase PdtaS